MSAEPDPDLPLLQRVAEGDARAVREMVARKLPRLLSLAQRLLGDRGEAEDIAQEAFVRLWKQAPHWRPGEAKFDSWLHGVALNLCRDRLRARRDIRAGDFHTDDEHDDWLDAQPDAAPGPVDRLALRQRDEGLGTALASLPPRQREALVLQYYQELPQRDAAQLMGISVDALESLLSRARRSLRNHLTAMAAIAGETS